MFLNSLLHLGQLRSGGGSSKANPPFLNKRTVNNILFIYFEIIVKGWF